MINVGVDDWGGVPVPQTRLAELIEAGPQDREVLPWSRAARSARTPQGLRPYNRAMAITDEKYVASTTFLRSGAAVATPVTGTAELVTSGPQFEELQSKVRAKYGFMVPMSRFFNTLGHLGKGKFPSGDVGVIITTDGSS